MTGKTRISAYGLLRKDDTMLLCRLSQRVMKSAGMWTLPGGGIDFGESPQTAMVREFREETGLIVEAGDIVTVDSMADSFNGRDYHTIRLIYTAHYVSGELAFEADGSTDQCEWHTREKIEELPLITLAQLGVSLAF